MNLNDTRTWQIWTFNAQRIFLFASCAVVEGTPEIAPLKVGFCTLLKGDGNPASDARLC